MGVFSLFFSLPDPYAMKIILSNRILLPDAPPEFIQELTSQLVFLNPKWKDNERMGRWNRDTPKYLRFYQETDEGCLVLPRGYARSLIKQCRRHGLAYEIDDRRRSLPEADFQFSGTLKPFQERAAGFMLAKEFGTLCAPTGSGKTVIALYMIARRRQPALIVVHTRSLADQWTARMETFLGIDRESIGFIGGGKKRVGDAVTVGMVQSLYRHSDVVKEHTGFLVVDECHRAPSRTFTEAVTAFDARYMLGLSATPWRRDRLSRLIFWHLGDMHYTITPGELIEKGHILEAEVVVRQTEFKPYHDPVRAYAKMLAELTADDERNALIAEDAAGEAGTGEGVCLILSDRKMHCRTLQFLLKHRHGMDTELLTGDVPPARREAVVRRIAGGESKILIATGQLIGEGFDCPNLTTLFIATPVRFGGRLIQYLGRILRPAPGKTKAKVYDYVDIHVPPLVTAANARHRIYHYGGEPEPPRIPPVPHEPPSEKNEKKT